jgi:proteasome lid subunit RPN8/RPN11
LINDHKETADLVREELAIPKVIMTNATYEAVMKDLSRKPFRREQGGILVGPIDGQNIAIRYVKDENGRGTYASFTIDFEGLNKEIREVRREGLICVGIIHSHPDGICHPSGGDILFLRRLFANPKNGGGNGYFIFPIVAGGELHPYLIDTDNGCRVVPTELLIV